MPPGFELTGAKFELGGVIGEDESSFVECVRSHMLIIGGLGMLFHGLIVLCRSVLVLVGVL